MEAELPDQDTVPEPSETGSILGELRADRRQLDQREPLELAIPGYRGLIAVYSPLEWKVINKLVEKVEKSTDELAELYTAADVLARACIDFKVERDEKRIPISELADDLEDGTPVRYDNNLAKALGIEDRVDSRRPARSTVIAVFANDFALVSHQNQVVNWFRGGEAEADF